MTRVNKKGLNTVIKSGIIVTLGLVVALIFFKPVNSSPGEVYVIVNSSLSNISLEDIKKAYKGEISKIQGKDIKLYEPPLDSPAKKMFIEKFLGLDLESYRKIWLVKLMGGHPIPKVAKEDEIIKNVSSQEGAIGYVPIPAQEDSVKVIAIK